MMLQQLLVIDSDLFQKSLHLHDLRHFRFDPKQMGTKKSLLFEEVVKAVVGLQGNGSASSLLSSLPCELCFNSLRDSPRRAAKQKKQSPAAIHCIAWQSGERYKFGCEGLPLDQQDWAQPLTKHMVKSSIHSFLRTTDRELGISCEGLTRHKTNKAYTKSHVFCRRLELLSVLTKAWAGTIGENEDRKDEIHRIYGGLWVSTLFFPGCFIRLKAGAEQGPTQKEALLVLRGGPYTVLCLKVTAVEVGYTVTSPSDCLEELMVTDISSHELAPLVPEVQSQLCWKRAHGWMSLTNYIASYSILDLSAKQLQSLCGKMKLEGHGKLDHRHRVELFLRHMGKSEDYITEVLSKLPERKKKVKQDEAEEEA